MNKKEFVLTIIVGTVIGGVLVLGVQQFFKRYELQKPITLSIGVHIQAPITKRNVISPLSTVESTTTAKIAPTAAVSPTKAILPSPTPKKRTMIKNVFASETKLKSYPYKEKIAYMDQGQKDVMTKVESTAGDAYAELIFRESGFHPTSVNSIGACGLGQALPCSKMNCELTDVDCQINWVKSYVERRYGTVEKALAFHDEKGWY